MLFAPIPREFGCHFASSSDRRFLNGCTRHILRLISKKGLTSLMPIRLHTDDKHELKL